MAEERLQNELLLFKRLLYKSKNQHSSSVHYKKLQLVRRIFGHEFTRKSLQMALDAIEEAYIHVKAVAQCTYFMSVNLTFMASLARLFVLTRLVLKTMDVPITNPDIITITIPIQDVFKDDASAEVNTSEPVPLPNLDNADLLSASFFAEAPETIPQTVLPKPSSVSSKKSSSKLKKKSKTSKNSIDDIFANFKK